MKIQPTYFLKSIKTSLQDFSKPTAASMKTHQKLWNQVPFFMPLSDFSSKKGFLQQKNLMNVKGRSQKGLLRGSLKAGLGSCIMTPSTTNILLIRKRMLIAKAGWIHAKSYAAKLLTVLQTDYQYSIKAQSDDNAEAEAAHKSGDMLHYFDLMLYWQLPDICWALKNW